ncbi:MAG: Uridine kinase [candidate division BRC1 bacterium ADurb.Bin183]|nr:MAG: Uridine kinase [candidate division BRC1 bacterium ADurb.Bin183]
MTVDSHITYIYKRNGRLVQFDQDRVTDAIFRAARSIGGEDINRAKELSDEVVRVLNETFEAGERPTVEEIQDIVIKVLEQNDHQATARAYANYRKEHAHLREGRKSGEVAETVPYKILWDVLSWNVDYGCESVEHLNEHVRRGTLPIIIEAAEKVYHDEIDNLAQSILKKKDKIRIVIIAGPSSSGKTTTTIKIGERLAEEKISLTTIGLDNYYKNLKEHPKDEFGDYDFERPESLDIELINEHLAALIRGEEIQMPFYNFKTGQREHKTTPFHMEANQILLIDSLHGLYEPLTASVPVDVKYKMYIEALCQIKTPDGEFMRWADLRMLRRMVRDSWARSYSPEMTVGHWHYVRKSEMQYIVPFISQANYIFNGSLPYELSVHKKYLWKYMDQIYNAYKDQPKRYDAFIRARRVYELLNAVTPIDDDSCIPRNSLMREYIGGSVYKY